MDAQTLLYIAGAVGGVAGPLVVAWVSSLSGAVTDLKSKVAVLEAAHSAASSRVDRLESDIVKKLDRLEEKLDRLISERE